MLSLIYVAVTITTGLATFEPRIPEGTVKGPTIEIRYEMTWWSSWTGDNLDVFILHVSHKWGHKGEILENYWWAIFFLCNKKKQLVNFSRNFIILILQQNIKFGACRNIWKWKQLGMQENNWIRDNTKIKRVNRMNKIMEVTGGHR